MKYKVGDTVRVKSLDWYKGNCTVWGDPIEIKGERNCFTFQMSAHCGQEGVIHRANVAGGYLVAKKNTTGLYLFHGIYYDWMLE